MKKICEYCGEEYEVYNYRSDTARFCSIECHNLSRKGKTYEETYGENTARLMREKQSIVRKGRGHPQTEEGKIKLRLARLKQPDPRLGTKHSEETKEKMKLKRANRIFPLKDTSIEIKVQNFLKQLRIEFLSHFYIKGVNHGYQCDILIPIQEGINQKIIIEVDGDYWHGNPEKFPKNKLSPRQIKQIEDDMIRNEELVKKGYKVIRLWENEINKMGIEEFKLKIDKIKNE